MDQQNRKKPFPESAVRIIAWDGPVRATAKAITAGLILVLTILSRNSIRKPGTANQAFPLHL